MKLSYQWLKEYVNIGVKPEELARGLTMSGSEVETIEDTGGDKVMNLEITSNRPDCLSIIGLAREASTVFDKDLTLPMMAVPEERADKNGPRAECVIKNKKLCPYYAARVITGVQVKGSSEKIKKYITSLGLRPVNNIVDATNFCLMETGQPLHAFDLDKIKGGKIIVREAAKGEKIVTIDGVRRELKPDMLVIADESDPIAIAGVMGGRDTEVTESTRNILLESAYFDPVSVRQTARSLGLSSDSSYRFERGVDKGMIVSSQNRAANLIFEEAGGKICGFSEAGVLKPEETRIVLDIERASRVLGESLQKKGVMRILERLGMTISAEKGLAITVHVPSFREDLKKEVDLIEEIARIYGYDRIPAKITKIIPQVTRKEHSRKVIEKIYRILPALGLDEIMTYSLISRQAAGRFSGINDDIVELKNPLSEEHQVLTPQLIDGMLRAVGWNINRGSRDLRFFEMGKIYSRAGWKRSVTETPVLCIALTGALRRDWQEGERPAGFYDLKGIVEALFETLKLPVEFAVSPIAWLDNAAEIRSAKANAGFLGTVDTATLGAYDISQSVHVCQIKLDGVIEKTDLRNHYHAIPKFPSSTRDISILCDRFLAAGRIKEVICSTGEDLIVDARLKDVYEGEQVGSGKKSLTYSVTYGLDTRTLTDQEIEGVHSRVKDALSGKLNVTFR